MGSTSFIIRVEQRLENRSKVFFNMLKIILILLLATFYVQKSEAHGNGSKRCKWLGNWSCKVSCKVLGHDSGACDGSKNCICSEQEYDFLSEIGDWFEENLDPSELIQKMENKFNEIKGTVAEWGNDNLRALVPSKCKISLDFCDKACRAIGKLNGRCNSDFTDCDCSDDWVTPIQYGLCASQTICVLDCQAKGKATGECKKGGGWDCECKSKQINYHEDVTEGLWHTDPETEPEIGVFDA